MAFEYSKIAEAVKLQDTATDIKVNAVSKTTYVRTLMVHNVLATPETVKLYAVPDSTGTKGTASDTENKFYEEAIPAKATRFVEVPPPGIMLTDENDSIQGVTTTNDGVLVWAYGGDK